MEQINKKIQRILEAYFVVPFKKSLLKELSSLTEKEISKAYKKGRKDALKELIDVQAKVDEEFRKLDDVK